MLPVKRDQKEWEVQFLLSVLVDASQDSLDRMSIFFIFVRSQYRIHFPSRYPQAGKSLY